MSPVPSVRRAVLLATALLWTGADAYTVKPGDTLSSLARTYRTTVAELTRLNGLTSTTLDVGQLLRLPGESGPPSPVSGAPSTPALAGLTVTAPVTLREGDAFVLRLSGARAPLSRVRFSSEAGEKVRFPAETLTPIATGDGVFVVLGRVDLGKTTPLEYEVKLEGSVMRRSIPVTGLAQQIQRLNLPASVNAKLADPARAAEDAAVERVYSRRTPPLWTRPFQEALSRRTRSSAFGQPRTYEAGGPVDYHLGTDYPAAAGTPVRAVNDGTVIMAGMYLVRGGLVIIDHGGGVSSLYFHQRRVTVKVGQKVSRGDPIGEVGSTGLSTGPHLHLELRVRGQATDPANWMNRLWPAPPTR
ncbi:LysM peptidoglycan-binding domain-containing M23 family metallopeptidase [Deinococcus sp. RM]|uniref:LysM peptidoglycan-binding domain-containing M23 family metallopeptidase n=1 Tax=Deinococcus sp. RM TaxID=2316359 RepID=UPI000E69803D|nr:M23 family metallopeptidase [Deinococcus sp. RM]RIX96733.1 LysM peptidoglycan-binding domain-containing protein [Deinococcus sp. RM]